MSIYETPMNHNGFLRKRKSYTIKMIDQEITAIYAKLDKLEDELQMLHELREVKERKETFESILLAL